MSDEYAVISIGVMTPDGSGAYRLWGIPRDQAEALVADLGEPHQEVLQTRLRRPRPHAREGHERDPDQGFRVQAAVGPERALARRPATMDNRGNGVGPSGLVNYFVLDENGFRPREYLFGSDVIYKA